MELNLNYISGINSDYIVATILSNTSIVEKEFFYPGRNCSFSAVDATSNTPFVGDLISILIAEYNISRTNITFSGKYVFTGTKMTAAEATGIIAPYLKVSIKQKDKQKEKSYENTLHCR